MRKSDNSNANYYGYSQTVYTDWGVS